MNPQEFDVVLEKQPGSNSTYIIAPFSVAEVFGSKAMVKVRGTIEGIPFRSILMSQGNGHHYMVVKQVLRAATGKSAGDAVHVVMEIDLEERTVAVPEDFAQALEAHGQAREIFEKFAFTHRREYVEWIEEAKKPETRRNRIVKAVEKIAQHGKLS